MALYLAIALLAVGRATANFIYSVPSNEVTASDGSLRGIRNTTDKDFVLGGLFPVHRSQSGGGGCGDITIRRSIERIEAMLYAIDIINNDSALLSDLSIGYDIRDTCMSENVGLDETVDVLFSGNQLDLDSCSVNLTKSLTTAVIGAAASSVTIPVASFLRLFNVPQVSYSSTSTTLNNRDRFNYFFRTIPSDDQQAQAIVDLILHFEWDYISAIHSNNPYGDPSIEQIKRLAASNGICIDLDEGIDETFTVANRDYDKLADKVCNSTANVIVLFASIDHVTFLMEAILSLQTATGNNRRFLWIGSDSWVNSPDIMKPFSSIIGGMWGTRPRTNLYQPFDDYLFELTMSNNARNPWFNDEYLDSYFDCSIVDCNDVSIKNANGSYTQDTVVPLVIDAVYSVAVALDNFIEQNCQRPVVWYSDNATCDGIGNTTMLTGTTLLDYLQNVNFTSPTGHQVTFNQFGSIQNVRYSIYNYQTCLNCTSIAYQFEEVGYWDGNVPNDHIVFYPNVTPQFGVDENGNVLFQLQSQCQQCPPGFIKQSVISSCCGTCRPCLGQYYTNYTTSSTQCDMCPQYMWGNSPLNGSTECIDIQESYLMPQDPWAIVLMIIAIIGLLSVVFVSSVFIWFWSTPIVKSSGREQMTLIMIGIILTFVSTIVFILKPSPAVCALRRIGSWSSLALILSALLVKLIRLTRIFLQKEVSGRPKCVGPWYQVLFTVIIWSVEFLIIVISLIVSMTPSVDLIVEMEQINNTMNSNDFPLLGINCASEYIAIIVLHVVYLSALIITSNALAILTIRFPANFNEAKFVAFSTFTVGLVWIASVATYFSTDVTTQSAVISFGIQLSSMCIIIGLFGGRVCMMIFFPSKNVKDKYYIGSTVENKPNEMARHSAMLSANMIPGLSSQRNSSLGNTNEIELQEKK